jgi:hypothetical protein
MPSLQVEGMNFFNSELSFIFVLILSSFKNLTGFLIKITSV